MQIPRTPRTDANNLVKQPGTVLPAFLVARTAHCLIHANRSECEVANYLNLPIDAFARYLGQRLRRGRIRNVKRNDG
jgi:hypothetical protein